MTISLEICIFPVNHEKLEVSQINEKVHQNEYCLLCTLLG